MLGEVEAGGFLFWGEAEADGFIHHEEDGEGSDDGDGPGDGNADELVQDLMGVAFEQAGGEGVALGIVAEDGVDGGDGEDTGEECSDGAASAVDAEGVERVVVAKVVFEAGDHIEAEDAGDEPDEQGGHGLDESRGGGDGDEAGDGSGDGSEGGGFAILEPLGEGPTDGCRGGGEVGGDKGGGGECSGVESGAGVEAEPAEPEEAGSDAAEDEGVGRHGGFGIADAFAEVEGGDEGGNPGGDVDDGAAGEVEAGEAAAGDVEQSADTPDHVGHGAVDDDRPEDEEGAGGGELHTLGEGSGDEGWGDDGEHELVDHVGLVGDGGCVGGFGGEADAAEEEVLESTDEGIAVAEGEGVADDGPEDGDDSHHGEGLHEGAEYIFSADEAGVVEGESGAGHEQDERSGDEHPCVVCVALGGGGGLLQGCELGLELGLGGGAARGRWVGGLGDREEGVPCEHCKDQTQADEAGESGRIAGK